jgi:hypothetical protein
MNPNNKEQLQKLSKIFNADKIVTSDDIAEVLKGILNIVKSYKESNEKLNKDTEAYVDSLLEQVAREHDKIKENVTNQTAETRDILESKLAEVKEIVANIQMMKPTDGVDGKDADEEYIIDEVMARIKLPEYKEPLLDTGEDIVDKINSLELSPEFQIDASHIKNLPEYKGRGFIGPRNITNMLSAGTNVTVSGSGTIDDPYVVNSTGGGGTPGGSDTQVQFNDGGSLGGNEGLVYNKTTRQLSLVSLDQPNGVARLQLQSYDETSTVGGDYSEVIRMDMMTDSAKAALAWRDSGGNSQVWVQAHDYLYWYKTVNVSSVDTTNDRLTVVGRNMPTGWQVTLTTTGTLPSPLTVLTNYYVRVVSSDVISLYPTSADANANTNKINLTTAGSGTIAVVPDNDYNYNRHKHWSVEVSKANGEKHTRLSIPYGYNTTEISVFDANMNIIGNMFRVLGNAGNNRQIIFGQNPPNSYLPGNYGNSPRWAVTCNNTAESGSNAGSDFQISRFNDNGGFLSTALYIDRSSGYVGIGDNATSPTAQLQIQRSTDINVLFGKNTFVGTNGSAVFLGEVYNVNGRVFQGRITGDTVARYSVNGAGVIEWGPGGASARDTNLYRASADNLQTDDNFTALSVTASGVTASRVAQFDANKKLESSAVTNTELGYVSGVTSAIQTQLNTMPYIWYRNHTASINSGGGTVTVTPTTVTAGLIDGTNNTFITVTFDFSFASTAETKTYNVTLYDGTNTISPASTGFTASSGVVSQTGKASFNFYRNSSTTASGDGMCSISQGLGTGSLDRTSTIGIATPATFDWSQALTITVTGNSTTANNTTLNNVLVTIG